MAAESKLDPMHPFQIDALGGAMAKAADLAAIQLRILNGSKGPAVRATRVQADRALYVVGVILNRH